MSGLKYLILRSSDDMNKWENPTKDQEKFMNLYLESINSRESDTYNEGIEEANRKGGVSYVSCQYLDNTIKPYGYKLEFPFGFYKLLSKEAQRNGYSPRYIFVYGIKPDDKYLSGQDIIPPVSSITQATVNRHWTHTNGLEVAGKIGKKKKKSAKKKSAKKKTAKKKI